jgi:uncharacterized protein YjbI with pentapeptide repeats
MSPDQSEPFDSYETGLGELLDRLGPEHPRYAEALTYEGRLRENVAQVRRHGDTETLRAERSRALARLNELALAELAVSFNELCGELSPEALEAIARHNPYRGLYAFREEDSALFYGREKPTEELVEGVRHKPLVAVLGPSGSGKSSVVFAGLVPRLRREGDWLIIDFRPKDDPFRGLAAALLPRLEPELSETDALVETGKLAAALSRGDLDLSQVLSRTLEKSPDAARSLLIVDQFEELYTLCPEPETRKRFVDTLLQPAPRAPAGESSYHMVLTLRADFLGQALAYRPLADALQGADVKLGPMTRDELRRAIEEPAMAQGVGFEPGLVDRFLDDVSDEPGGLPLLEFALTALWEEQRGGKLTHAAYNQIGEVEGALSSHAEQVYAGLSPADQEGARRAFVSLVQLGEGTEDTRRLAHRSELAEADWDLVGRLASQRLVVTGRDPEGRETVEVVHEALIRGWDRLGAWIESDRDFLVWRKRLRAAQIGWEASQEDEGALLRGRPLEEAETWLAERAGELGPDEREFIQASLALRDRQAGEQKAQRRRWRLVFGALGVAFLAVLLLLGRSWWSSRCLQIGQMSELGVYCQGISLFGVELFEAELSGIKLEDSLDLRGARLRGADLVGASLEGGDLSGADLRQADLSGARLGGATLRGADLSGADLEGADLGQAELVGADLAGADLSYAQLNGSDLSGADLGGTNLLNAELSDAHLRGAVIDAATQIDERYRLAWEVVSQGGAGRDLRGAALDSADLRGVDLRGADLREAGLFSSDLRGADLSGADLKTADLGGADLRGADLTGADLYAARLGTAQIDESTRIEDKYRLAWQIVSQGVGERDLRGVDLSGADLEWADLRGVDLSGADLDGARLGSAQVDESTRIEDKYRLVWELVDQGGAGRDLSGADLSQAYLSGAFLSGADLSGADLSGAVLRWARLSQASLEGADLRGADLRGAVMKGADLRGAVIDEAARIDDEERLVWVIVNQGAPGWDLRKAVLREVDLSGADLGGADLREAILVGTDLGGADLSGADLREADLSQVDLGRADLARADLGAANLFEANLSGADLGGAVLDRAILHSVVLDESTRLADKYRLVWQLVNQGGAERDLRGQDLSRADLTRADLRHADLRGADLSEAELRGVAFHFTRMDDATQIDPKWRLVWEIVNQGARGRDLSGADLSGADLSGANLGGADLDAADLRGANLSRADLREASLSGASLDSANLRGADLSGASLSEYGLFGAGYDGDTRWPDGFDPEEAGAVLVE